MRAPSALLLLSLVALTSAGCVSSNYNGHGIVFGCDGSGAGIVLKWGPPARAGARKAGYAGVFEAFRWQTGLGVAVDHGSSVQYKRSAARKLADRIQDHQRRHPDDPIYVAGLSAGCAVAIFALEALPAAVQVEHVFLLSSSVSAQYDLTRALQRVRGKLYSFHSHKDGVLRNLASVVGTADKRNVGDDISGLRGFRPPPGATQETVALYEAKVQNTGWRPEFARYGHHGGHTDVVATDFVARYVGPYIVPAARR